MPGSTYIGANFPCSFLEYKIWGWDWEKMLYCGLRPISIFWDCDCDSGTSSMIPGGSGSAHTVRPRNHAMSEWWRIIYSVTLIIVPSDAGNTVRSRADCRMRVVMVWRARWRTTPKYSAATAYGDRGSVSWDLKRWYPSKYKVDNH